MAEEDETTKEDGPEEEGETTSDAAPPSKPAPAKPDAPAAGSGLAKIFADPRIPLVLAVAVPALFFMALPPLTRSGLWDPHELNVADLARRVALNLHHADKLALEGADNSLPHLNDLGRPQLPFTSIALGFATFGLHEWSGRLPLAIWGLLGVLATYGWVTRLVDRKAGLFSAIALTTMPLYFVQARTMLGDIVTMSALSMSFGGLAVFVFDRDGTSPALLERGPHQGLRGDRPKRFGWLLVGLVGLASGWFSRGGILGLAVPLVGVGAAWLVAMAGGARKGFGIQDAVAALALGVGGVVAYKGFAGLQSERIADLDLWVGAMIRPQSRYPTFDYFIGHLGPALAPWSGFIPFAMGRLYVAPVGPQGFAYQRESEARMAILVGAAVCLLAHGLMAPRTDLIAFSGPAILAASCGIALRDYERGAHPSIAVGVGTGVFLGLFHHDFHQFPEKAYQAFSVVGATFPESFKDRSLLLWTLALVGFAGIAFLTWVERKADRAPFDPERYLGVVRALRDAWDGLLSLAYFATVAGASLAGLAIWVGTRTHAKWLPTLSGQIRDGVLNAWWITAIVPLAAILATYFWCDVWLWAFGKGQGKVVLSRGFEPFEDVVRMLKEKKGEAFWVTALVLLPLLYLQVPVAVFGVMYKEGVKPLVALALAIPSGIALMLALGIVGDLLKGSRAAFLVLTSVVTGGILCLSYYPALANQLSPKEVFESYQRLCTPTEPLGLYGVGGRTAAYYAGGQPHTLHDNQQALDWLSAAPEGSRRCLALSAGELARLNFSWRQKKPGQNVPVLDARSSQILLAASSLAPGEPNQNPLGRIILAGPPTPQRKLDANLEDKLLVLGIDILDPSTDKKVDVVRPGKKYHLKAYYKVLAPVGQEWEAFIHIDGFHRRHNGDHKPMEGKYPMSLWLPGDYLLDDHEFTLEPNFTPGAYTIYFGLYSGETRLKIKSGPADPDGRVIGGNLNVQ